MKRYTRSRWFGFMCDSRAATQSTKKNLFLSYRLINHIFQDKMHVIIVIINFKFSCKLFYKFLLHKLVSNLYHSGKKTIKVKKKSLEIILP